MERPNTARSLRALLLFKNFLKLFIMDLLMAFIDESESYVNGFEMGKIWAYLELGNEIENWPIHNKNINQIIKMCELLNVKDEYLNIDETWTAINIKFKDVDLNKLLLQAIKNEDFESAAILRDKIKDRNVEF